MRISDKCRRAEIAGIADPNVATCARWAERDAPGINQVLVDQRSCFEAGPIRHQNFLGVGVDWNVGRTRREPESQPARSENRDAAAAKRQADEGREPYWE